MLCLARFLITAGNLPELGQERELILDKSHTGKSRQECHGNHGIKISAYLPHVFVLSSFLSLFGPLSLSLSLSFSLKESVYDCT